MALDRQVELAMDAMQASHDAMLGHMALVREAMSFEPLDPKDDDDKGQPVKKPKEDKSEAEGETQVAGDVVPIERKEPIQIWNVEKPAGFQAESPEHAGAVASGVLRGSLHILKPTPTEGK